MMEAPAPRRRLTLSMIMVIVAFLANALAGATATYRDPTRPDFMLAIYCFYASLRAAAGFSRNTGRALAGTWGESLGTLVVFFAGELWMETVFTPLPSNSSVLHLLLWNYWPPLVAFQTGMLSGFLARRRYDRRHNCSEDSPASAAAAPTLSSGAFHNQFTTGMVMVIVGYAAVIAAAILATARDSQQADWFLVIVTAQAGFWAFLGFSRNRGRDLAGTWGFASWTLTFLVACELWLELSRSHSATNPPAMAYFFVFAATPLAILVGLLGTYLGRRRYDREHPTPIPPVSQ